MTVDEALRGICMWTRTESPTAHAGRHAGGMIGTAFHCGDLWTTSGGEAVLVRCSCGAIRHFCDEFTGGVFLREVCR